MEDWMIPAGIAGAGVLGSIASENQAGAERKASRQDMEKILAQIQGIQDPDLQAHAIEQYSNQYNFSPEQAQALKQQASTLSNYQTDPALRQTQMNALAQLGQISNGGFTDADRAAIQSINMQNDTAERGNQDAIMQDMQRRGQGGSGQELASRMISNQGAANRAADQSRAVMQMGQQRALQALAQQGQMASSLRGQDLTEEEKRAQAGDAINRFNAQNGQQVLMANTQAANQAAQQRALNTQGIANQNTDIRNAQAAQPNALNQQRYNNVMSKYSTMMGGTQNYANMGMQSAAAANQGRYNTIQGIEGIGNKVQSGYAKNSDNNNETYDPKTDTYG